MSSKKTAHHKNWKRKKSAEINTEKKKSNIKETADLKYLDIILKCDTSGCSEAIISSLKTIAHPQVRIDILSSGVGSISKTDIFMAETGSRLIIGFNVGLMPHIDELAAEHNVEIRLYEVIYRLMEDIESIVASLIPQKYSEQIIGTAKVIALFKSSRKGIILGCEVMQGKLSLGQPFRVVGTMGPKYVGVIESLHIEEEAVREATTGQQAGLKIRDFNKARIGDLVESFKSAAKQNVKPWKPQGKIFYP